MGGVKMIFIKRFFSIFFHGTAKLYKNGCLQIDGDFFNAPDHETRLSIEDCLIGIFLAGFMGVFSVVLILLFAGFLTNVIISLTSAIISLKSLLVIWLTTVPIWLIFFCWKRIRISLHYAKKGYEA